MAKRETCVGGEPVNIRGGRADCGECGRSVRLSKAGQLWKHPRNLVERPNALPDGWQELFLRAYRAVDGNLTRAAENAGVGRQSVYKEMERDPEFKEAVADVYEALADEAEDELYRRGVYGWEEPIYQGGKLVGHVKRFDTAALMHWLRAHRSRKYAPRLAAVIQTDSGTVGVMIGRAIESLESQGHRPDVLELAPPDDADLDRIKFAGEELEVLPPIGSENGHSNGRT